MKKNEELPNGAILSQNYMSVAKRLALLNAKESPIVVEISRALKKVTTEAEDFEQNKDLLMRECFVMTKEGGFALNEAAIKRGKENKGNPITYFTKDFKYGSKKLEKKFEEDFDKLRLDHTVFDFNTVNVNDRMVEELGNVVPLKSVLWKSFTGQEIDFLEEINLLTGLDD